MHVFTGTGISKAELTLLDFLLPRSLVWLLACVVTSTQVQHRKDFHWYRETRASVLSSCTRPVVRYCIVAYVLERQKKNLKWNQLVKLRQWLERERCGWDGDGRGSSTEDKVGGKRENRSQPSAKFGDDAHWLAAGMAVHCTIWSFLGIHSETSKLLVSSHCTDKSAMQISLVTLNPPNITLESLGAGRGSFYCQDYIVWKVCNCYQRQ